MKKLMMVAATLGALAAWSASPVQGQAAPPAQDTKAAQGMKAPEAKGKTMQLTGCLGKGADANSFVLSNAMASTGAAMAGKDAKADASMHADMKSYRVTAKEDLKLTGHVGHKIEVTGQLDSSAAGSMGSMGSTKSGDAGAATSGAGASATAKSGAMPQLTVTAMKHIAPTCP